MAEGESFSHLDMHEGSKKKVSPLWVIVAISGFDVIELGGCGGVD